MCRLLLTMSKLWGFIHDSIIYVFWHLHRNLDLHPFSTFPKFPLIIFFGLLWQLSSDYRYPSDFHFRFSFQSFSNNLGLLFPRNPISPSLKRYDNGHHYTFHLLYRLLDSLEGFLYRSVSRLIKWTKEELWLTLSFLYLIFFLTIYTLR